MNTLPPKDEQPDFIDDEVEASRAPLLEHLTELRSRLIKSLVALMIGTIACFFFAQEIFELLLAPFALMAAQKHLGPKPQCLLASPHQVVPDAFYTP